MTQIKRNGYTGPSEQHIIIVYPSNYCNLKMNDIQGGFRFAIFLINYIISEVISPQGRMATTISSIA